MRKAIVLSCTLALLALSGAANAITLTLVAHNQRSSSGTLSTLKWAGPSSSPAWTCATYTSTDPCINPANANLAAMGITASTAVWNWNEGTGVLSMTGAFNTASTLGSSGAAAASTVIGDKVTDMVINTGTATTTAATYNCAEGSFLAGVGAHGCANVSTGGDFVYNSSMAYNVGGNANCIVRTLGGDDTSTGNPRGLMSAAAAGGCDAVDGAFNLWTVVSDTTSTGGTLVLSNGIATSAAGTNYLTFTAVPEAADDGPFDALESIALNIDVLANDVGFVDPVTVTVTTPPTQGTYTVNGSPGPKAGISIDYTANVGATGADSFVYTLTDGVNTDTATVTLNVLPFGANDDTASTTRNHAQISIPVGANDAGFTDPVTITITAGPSAGGAAVAPAPGTLATQAISYTPANTAAGTPTYTETFTYQVNDGVNPVDTATVTVTVSNTVPVAGNGPITISTAGSAPGSVTGTFNAGTFAGNSLGNTPSVVTATPGANGTTSVAGNVVTYTPAVTFFKGTDTFNYTITDSDPAPLEAATGMVTVTIADISPLLADVSITTTEGTASAATALGITPGNGSVAQHDLAVTTQATNGTCAISGTSVTYTPAAGYSGADSCVITITDEDGAGQSDTGTASITVNAAPSSGGVSSGLLPGGGGALDPWSLALLAAVPWLYRRRLAQRGVAANPA